MCGELKCEGTQHGIGRIEITGPKVLVLSGMLFIMSVNPLSLYCILRGEKEIMCCVCVCVCCPHNFFNQLTHLYDILY
jgi:hypothetical protein